MSKISELILDIQTELAEGKLSFYEISMKFKVPMYFVNDVWENYVATRGLETKYECDHSIKNYENLNTV